MQHSVPRQAAFRAFGAVADGAERTFDRVGCSDALPVPGGEIKEGHHLFAVLLQAQRGLGVFRVISLEEQVKHQIQL